MDDCNSTCSFTATGALTVQIPLWTIVTELLKPERREEPGSDSSMDDCNGDYGSVARPDVLSSDSSMDDCNT